MAYGKVELCGVDTTKLPVLSAERMRELFPRVHAGDKAARDEFIQGNLRLVLSVLQRFASRGESADDYILKEFFRLIFLKFLFLIR